MTKSPHVTTRVKSCTPSLNFKKKPAVPPQAFFIEFSLQVCFKILFNFPEQVNSVFPSNIMSVSGIDEIIK